MGCNCGGTKTTRVTYTHTAKDGTKTAVATEAQAKAAVARHGGTYKKD